MKGKMIKFSLICLILGVVMTLTACPSTEPSSSATSSISPIAKVTLMTNGSALGGYLQALSYERTPTAHKFYVKTTFVDSNYINKIRDIDSAIVPVYTSRTSTGAIWAPLIIGIDTTTSAVTKGGINLNTLVWTADTNFEFDAIIRYGQDKNQANMTDGTPLFGEGNTVYLNVLKDGNSATNGYYWSSASQKKYQADAKDKETEWDDTIMIDKVKGVIATNVSGAAKDVTNVCVVLATSGYYGYDATAGEYYFAVPFSVIGAEAIKAVTCFGVQVGGWRDGKNAVIHPLGCDVPLVLETKGGVKGMPSCTVPVRSGDTVTITPANIEKAADSIGADVSVYAIGTATTNVTFGLLSASNAASLDIKLAGVGVTNTITLYPASTNAIGYVTYTNIYTLTCGLTGSSKTYMSDVNFSLSYFSATSPTNTISVIVVKPTYTVDGLVSTDYGVSKGAGASIATWAGCPTAVYMSSASSVFYLALEYTTYPNANNITIVIDDNDITGGFSDFTGNLGTGWGNYAANNTAGVDVDYVLWNWKGDDGSFAQISNQGIKYPGATAAVTGNNAARSGNILEIAIPYANIGSGAAAGHKINVYYLFGDGKTHDFFPANISTGSGTTYLDVIGAKSTIDYTLN